MSSRVSLLLFLPRQGDQKMRDMAKAFEYAARSCELGHKYGCINAARQLQTGDGVPEDADRAEHFKKRAKELHVNRSV